MAGMLAGAATGIWAAVEIAFEAKAVLAMITSILQMYKKLNTLPVTILLINIIEIIFKSKSQFAIQANFITQLYERLHSAFTVDYHQT